MLSDNIQSLDLVSIVLTALGTGGGYILIKWLLPVIKSTWESSTTNSRAERDMIAILQKEVIDLHTLLDSYKAREASYIDMAANFKLIEFQLEQAKEQIQLLTAEVAALREASTIVITGDSIGYPK